MAGRKERSEDRFGLEFGAENPPLRERGPIAKPRHAPSSLEHYRQMLHTHMERKNLRSTDQRRRIIEIFFRSPNHVSIEELLADVRREDARVGYATVYRTLKLLAECGVAFERRFGDGLTRYELADDASHHDHLICVDCGDIIEFEEPAIETLQEKVAERYGYELRSHKHEMYGVCPECQTKTRPGAAVKRARGQAGRQGARAQKGREAGFSG